MTANTAVRISGTGPLKILMATVFYPRGGSAQVIRYLARALSDLGHTVLLVSGTLKGADPTNDAARFFRGLRLVEVDYTEAARGFAAGLNPMSDEFGTPFHPSYEDKPDAPDRVFYRVNKGEAEHLVASWRDVLSEVTRTFQPDVAHLHHLNHLHMAASRLPGLAKTTKVAHLHGTELKMLADMKSYAGQADSQQSMWDRDLRKAAAGMQHFVAISPDNVERAGQVLEIERESITLIPNGVDTRLFRPMDWPTEERMALLEELLVTSPRGWDESGAVGSVRYDRERLDAFLDPSGSSKPLLVFVGRFLAFKRLTLLLEAVARASHLLSDGQEDPAPFNVLILGGVPGEWEGEHPHSAAERLGLRNVFFAGWLGHEELAKALNLGNVFVAPSYFEPFGQVFLEAMATGLPVIATRSGGPLSFVAGDGEKANGWLANVDDADSLARAIVEAVSDEEERRRRGRNALKLVRADYEWSKIALRFESLYRRLLVAAPSG